jgi:hypothetical protein
MLRITIHDELDTVTFKLEGRLAGCWVRELEDCYERAMPARPELAVRFDLKQVTSLDAEGKAFLAERQAEGAELVTAGCCMKAIIAEIARWLRSS